jgi:hypothetical protein
MILTISWLQGNAYRSLLEAAHENVKDTDNFLVT